MSSGLIASDHKIYTWSVITHAIGLWFLSSFQWFYYRIVKLGIMNNNQIQVLPFFIITFAILISGFTVIFTWAVTFHLPVRLRTIIYAIFLMNLATISIFIVVSTFSLYLIFLVLGVGGISKNRIAQGLDQKPNK